MHSLFLHKYPSQLSAETIEVEDCCKDMLHALGLSSDLSPQSSVLSHNQSLEMQRLLLHSKKSDF